MQRDIYTSIGQNNTGETPDSEQNQKPQCKQHWRSLPQTSSVQSSQPTENFNSCRNRNNHCCRSKISTCVNIKSHSIHVVSPNQKTKNSNCTHCIYHPNISKNGFTSKESKDMTHNTESRQNLHVYFGMPKKPKQVLVQNYVTTTCWLKKACIEISIGKKHCQSCCKNWKTSNLQNANVTNRPYKQRQTIQSHSLSTHVRHSHKKINASQNASNTCNVLTKNSLVYRCSRVTQCTAKWRVRGPSYSGSLFNLSTLHQQCKCHWEYPETNIIHSREGHHFCFLRLFMP